jgi:hypothetical protein
MDLLKGINNGQEQMDTSNKIKKHFNKNPEDVNAVMKAYHAYHVDHFRSHRKAHNFLSSSRISECEWCGRTREDVRWDTLPPECQMRPAYADIPIGDALTEEEAKAHAVYDRAKGDVPRLVKKMGMSGNTLAKLHHTHGYDPETVSGIVDVPQDVMEEYHSSMEIERDTSRKAIVREVVTCVFDETAKQAEDK